MLNISGSGTCILHDDLSLNVKHRCVFPDIPKPWITMEFVIGSGICLSKTDISYYYSASATGMTLVAASSSVPRAQAPMALLLLLLRLLQPPTELVSLRSLEKF